MDSVRRGTVTLNARSCGERAPGREILLIHGLNANMAFWHPLLVRELAARHFLVMYDQRGHGRSDMPPAGYTSSELARDAVAVMDEYGLEQADVVAHSLGSGPALQIARHSPGRVRSLILLDARLRAFQPVLTLGDWPEFERWKATLGAAGEKLSAELPLDFMVPLYLADGGLRGAGQDLVANGFAPVGGGRRGAAQYRRLLAETTAPDDYQSLDGLDAAAIASLAHPVMAIYGARSPFLETLSALQQALPRCEGRLVEDGGHNFPVRCPAPTARLITEFLDARRAAS